MKQKQQEQQQDASRSSQQQHHSVTNGKASLSRSLPSTPNSNPNSDEQKQTTASLSSQPSSHPKTSEQVIATGPSSTQQLQRAIKPVDTIGSLSSNQPIPSVDPELSNGDNKGGFVWR